MIRLLKPVTAALLVLAAAGCGSSSEAPAAEGAWKAAWGTAIYTHYPNGPLTQASASPNSSVFLNQEAVEQSFRMMIHPSIGGTRLRLRFSNAFGDRPLLLRSVSVGRRAGPTGAAIVPGSARPLRFHGADSVSIPAGGDAYSDAVDFAFEAGDDLAISFHVPGPSGPMSWHAEAFSTQYVSAPNSGDVTADDSGAAFANVERGWFFLRGLDVAMDATVSPREQGSVVVFGDSITDGFAATMERNERYPDVLARRLQAAGLPFGVVNVGINSNSVTPTRNPVTTGRPGLERFRDDVLTQSGARSVFILLGTNDLSAGVKAETVYAGLVVMAREARDAGLCVVVGTILPRNDPPVPFGWDAASEEPERRRLNALLLASDAFDAVADVGKVMENPAVAHQPFQPYFAEGLHPNSLGMAALGSAIPLAPLLPPPHGDCRR